MIQADRSWRERVFGAAARGSIQGNLIAKSRAIFYYALKMWSSKKPFMAWLDWIKEYYFFNFFALYIFGGRTAAILSAQWLGQSLLFFFPLVVFMDILQIPLFYRAYEGLLRLSFLSRLGPWLERRRQGLHHSWAWRIWSAWRGLGVFLITLMPVRGGGMWSGVLMAFSLKIPKRASYPILIGGSVAGCLLLLGLGETLGYLWP